MGTLVGDIISFAQARGIQQRELAVKAQLPEETLSRVKRRGSAQLRLVEALAAAAGLRLVLEPMPKLPDSSRTPFRVKYRTLVWSNPEASDELYIRKALLTGQIAVLTDAVAEYGIDRVTHEWSLLTAENAAETRQVRAITERILTNIQGKDAAPA